MNVLLVGCGSIGSRHVRNLLRLDVEAVTVVDARFDWVGKVECDPRISYTTSLAAATETKADAALICTPADTHAAVARELLAVGYAGPLLVEKPIVTRLEDAEVFRAWPHPVQMVGYNWHWHVDMAAMQGLTGTGCHVEFACYTNMADWPGSAKAGDPALECSHEIASAIDWLGIPSRIDYCGETASALVVRMTHPIGTSQVVVEWDATRTIRWVDVRRGAVHGRWEAPAPYDARLDESYFNEMAYFLACAETGTPIERGATFADGLDVVGVIERARKAVAA